MPNKRLEKGNKGKKNKKDKKEHGPVRILFVLKQRHFYGDDYNSAIADSNACGYSLSSGLLNSAKFVVDMLNDAGAIAKLVEVVDNNCIDREVSLFKPDYVVLEALWVVPEKIDILTKLYPDVSWIVRIHSELLFLSQEGTAIDWIAAYAKKRVVFAANSQRTIEYLQILIQAANPQYTEAEVQARTAYLPNFYPDVHVRPNPFDNGRYVHVGCFGALRPLKNFLNQAFAAIMFAQRVKKDLRFHINASRVEQSGGSCLRNLRSLFKALPHAYLVEHDWMPHANFIDLIKTMDVSMQVSLTETFSIISADATVCDVPILVSNQVPWAPNQVIADTTDLDDMADGLYRVTRFPWIATKLARRNLTKYCSRSKQIWLEYLEVN